MSYFKNILFIASVFVGSLSAMAQYVLYDDVPVISPITDAEMQFPFAGGFNNPQFSDIDFNQDGKQDLFVFDRSGNRAMVLERISEPGLTPVFRFSLDFDEYLPFMRDWALTYDFNCDGLPDIFTYISGSAAVYKAYIEGGKLHYALFKDELQYFSTFELPIYTSRTDLPGFADVDGDGDMDVLAFSVTGVQIRWYENQSADMGYACDSLIFEVNDYCWGAIFEGATCGGADLGIDCFGYPFDEEVRMHVGSTILPFDQDGDGDQDLVLGDVSCNNLVFYRNGGSPLTANMVEKDTVYPSNTIAAKVSEFPGAYLTDLDQDGFLDLVVAPNDDLFSVNYGHILQYTNQHAADSLVFAYETSTYFAANDMDMGDFSHPVWLDIDGDGLQDLLVGVGNTRTHEGGLQNGLWYWRNSGTVDEPAFTLVNDDQFNFDDLNLSYLSPAVGDTDNDGDLDILIGHQDGTLSWIENLAGIGMPFEAAEPVFLYADIDLASFAAPAIIDVDLDGKNDLIIGEANGNLNYFHGVDGGFAFVSNNWGGVDVRLPGDLVGYSTPFIYRNTDGLLQLLVGSTSGRIFQYDEIEASLLGEFHLRDSLFLGHDPGQNSTISGADINGDTEPEFIIGNRRGGLTLFRKSVDIAIAELPEVQWNLYPNPIGKEGILYLNGLSGNYTLHIRNTAGQLVSQFSAYNPTSLDISWLTSGVYILIIGNEDFISSKYFVK